ncbi:MAG TPA: hypothetical protein VME22_13715 [Solirubrobacteraceae bacterium]|nr:hypothetical protein [Solirubrobacteraceae bacterium]
MTSTTGVPIAALLVAALLAGCGGSTGGGVTQRALARALRAAACMRANGVPSYPAPKLINGTIRVSFTASLNPTTPTVQAAAQKCGYQAEQQAGETSSRIAFARCMRAHGVRRFPYPTADGSVSPAMVQAAGINIDSAAVAKVVGECLPPWLRPGTAP